MPGPLEVAFQEPSGMTLDAPRNPILRPFASMNTDFLASSRLAPAPTRRIPASSRVLHVSSRASVPKSRA